MWHHFPSLEQYPQMTMSLYSPLALFPVLQTNNELEAQRVATEFAFRKRLREREKVYSELRWQEKNVSFCVISRGLEFLQWDGAPDTLPRSPGFSAPWWVRLVETQSLCPLQTLEEIAELQEDIRHLEEDLRRKFLSLKLSHTRLESRSYRPNVELCRDQVRGYSNGHWPPCYALLRITLYYIFLMG